MTAEQHASHGAAHLIGEVQRFGLYSAAAVVGRYAGLVNRALANNPMGPPDRAPEGLDGGWLADGAVRMAESSLRLLDTAMAMMDRAGQGPAGENAERLLLPSTESGSPSEVSLWIHNPTSSQAVIIELHVTPLTSATGLRLPADAVSVTPAQVDVLDAGTSREIRLRVDVPADQPAGCYHGLVLSSAAPSEPMALSLEVQVRGGSRS